MIYIPLQYLPDQTVVLETDLGGDVDDVGALALLLDGSKRYGYRMGGVSLNRIGPRIPDAVRALLCARGFNELPIAHTVPGVEFESPYVAEMAKLLPEGARRETVPVQEFYRKLFAQAEDRSVTIVSVGFLQNLDIVWREDPALFEKKVRSVLIMGGSFLYKPEYKEYNFTCEGHLRETSDFVENYPGQVIYIGWEAGGHVWTDVSPKKDISDPVVAAYEAFGRQEGCFPYRRQSWDPVTADFAIHGENGFYRLSPNVRVWLEEGMTRFAECPEGNAAFVILNQSEETVSGHISEAILETI